ncbi:MAG: ATP-binding protein [Cyanobium sp.]
MRLVSALALASALPLALLTLAIGTLNWWNGQRSAQALAYGLGKATSEQVRLQLDGLLADPRQINTLNSSAIGEGRLDPADFRQMGQTFISQMGVFPVSYINYGSQEGDFIGVERLENGRLQLNLTERRLGPSRQFVFAIGPAGPASTPLQVYDPIEPATREAWYTETARTGRPTWSSIYQWDDKPEVLSISYNEPLFHPDGRLRGVIGVDFTLSQLSSRLAAIWGRRAGLVLISELDGQVVASSAGSPVINRPGEPPRRRRLDQSSNPLEREATRLLFVPDPSGKALRLNRSMLQRSPGTAGTRQKLSTSNTFIAALPWSDSHGLNWLVMVIIPKQSLTATIQQQTLLTSLLGLLSLAVLLLLSTRLTRWILAPLEALSTTARELSATIRRSPGTPLRFEPRLGSGSAEEISTLGQAFNTLIQTFNGMVAAQRRSSNALERELEQKAAALDGATRREREAIQASASRERFLGHLGQELLQPVADLRGATRLARQETDGDRLQQHLDRLDGSSRRLERLARILRDHAGLADGALALSREPIDLGSLLESTVAELTPSARSRGLALHWRMAPETPAIVQANGERLRQVLELLISRGISASRQGGVALEASPLLEGRERWVRLQIHDNGSGVDADRLGRAFGGPEELAAPPVDEQLSDLGLALSSRLVGLMGGHGAVEHRPGEGTTVTLQLPAGSDQRI